MVYMNGRQSQTLRIASSLESLRSGSAPLFLSLIYVLAILTGAAAAFGIVLFLHSHLGDNQCADMFWSQLLLRGVKPYGPAMQETNPPFLIWFTSIPVLLGTLLHTSPIHGFQIFAIGIIGSSNLWSLSLFRRLARGRGLLFWAFAFALVFLTLDLVHNETFGEREHFLTVLLVPYLLLAAMRLAGQAVSRWEMVAIGLVAAAGICLKPQQILIPFAVELLVLLWVRRAGVMRNPALLALVATGVIYVIATWIFTPAYFRYEAPLALQLYWGFDAPYSILIRSVASILVAIAVCTVLYLFFRRFLSVMSLPPVLACAALAGVIAYIQQHKYFYYHAIPARVYALLLALMLLAQIVSWLAGEDKQTNLINLRWKSTAVLSAGAFIVTTIVGAGRLPHPGFAEPEKQFVSNVLAHYPPGTRVGYLSTAPYWEPAVMEQDKVFVMRYMHLWPLPALIISADPAPTYVEKRLSPAQAAAVRQMLFEQITEDLRRSRPAVVFVEDCEFPLECAALRREGYGSLATWFAQYPEFRQEWSYYRFEQTGTGLDVYTRNDGGADGTSTQAAVDEE